MGTFLCIGCFVVFVTFCIVAGWYAEQQKRPVDVPLGKVPRLVRDEAERRVAGLTVERVMKRPHGDTYRLYGQAGGQPIRIKVRLVTDAAQPFIEKIEIQPETRSSHRSLKGKHLVEMSSVPETVMQQTRRIAEASGAPLEEVSRVKAATVQGRDAYDIKGWSGQWRVEVELLDDGLGRQKRYSALGHLLHFRHGRGFAADICSKRNQ